ncbi:acyl-CoA thioester hydrolase/BAAT C-terminal domain-containing protein [Ferrovibrio sp.]|uniref:alpha/beta hydrolase family protein n=1 Tax=Ferrovibrio sp. TaxID=1917215 RepID=UPI00261E453B|nr:acyl-CoA thioester hydrolase/BAAT C-terminal domain-containing protein [Ferrovibrio sp.]
MPLQIVNRYLPDLGPTYSPPGEGPFPAVLLLHGSEGAWAGWTHRAAVILAAHGFLAFPFGYSVGGNGWNAGSIIDVPLDKTEASLARLRALPLVNGKVGIYGVSRGAEHALLLTALMVQSGCPDLPNAVAVHSPPDVICGAFKAASWRDQGDPGWQVWDPALRAWTWRGTSDALLPTTPIGIEIYEGPLFLSHGTADKIWSVEMTRRLEARLRQNGRDPEVHYYEDQGHALGSAADNIHNEKLIAFFGRHLNDA